MTQSQKSKRRTKSEASPGKSAAPRFPFFDSLRGFAMIIMAIYHFSFDLNQFGVIQQDMNHSEFWLNFRALIMTSFLSLVGVSFLFSKCQYSSPSFRKRLLKISACAAVISIGTYFLNPETWIYFGVLHLILLASLLSPLLVKFPKTMTVLGVALIALPNFYRSFWFQDPILHLTGLSPLKPNTEDFAPLTPWLGVIFVGIGVGAWVVATKPRWALEKEWPSLSKLGQHSLVFYMTHQLVLYPLAWIISQIV